MKKTVIVSMVVTISLLICGCNGNNANLADQEDLQNKVDSQKTLINDMDWLLETVNLSLDSITKMEGSILHTIGESPMSRKEQIMRNIQNYKVILKNQHERITLLEEKLKKGGISTRNLQKTIEILKAQLAEKDKAIVELTEELEKRNFDINNLKQNVTKLSSKVTELEKETKAQEEALTIQTDMMNEAYVLIGTAKELKSKGVLSGGALFKKSKFDASKINTEDFKKIDIRNTTSFSIPSKKAKIMTSMPADSYTIRSNGDGTCTINVTNPTRFWSVSNYLVVKY